MTYTLNNICSLGNIPIPPIYLAAKENLVRALSQAFSVLATKHQCFCLQNSRSVNISALFGVLMFSPLLCVA